MSQPERAARLLVRAVDSLKPNEQRVVFEALLTGSIGRTQAHAWPSPELMRSPMESRREPDVRQMEQPLLVRLPSDLHGRLRRWANSNGFSMAAVARGLIERFLDDQDRSS